jgi:hypothetical protein
VGRRHLSFLAAFAVALALAAPAGAGLRWHELARGEANLAQLSNPVAFVAADRNAAYQFAVGLPDKGNAAIGRVDFRRNAVVAVFGDFGCKDHRVVVSSLTRRGAKVTVSLVTKPLAPGTMECQAIFTTYRLLVVAKSQLGRPFPSVAEAKLARA